jgi:sterol desaturase/sphingolipid hydroxylase (fatty acid hydroxylase superfamily)
MHYPINHSKEPIRLFRSDFLEFFTHISPVAVVLIWLPVIIYFLVRGIALAPAGSSAQVPSGFVAGILFWTFAEYMLHRFMFHYVPHGPLQERIVFLFHGIHHAQPQCKTRLVMPPVVSVPMAAVYYALLYVLLDLLLHRPDLIPPLYSGTIMGYLCYDLLHYAAHHFPMRWGILKFLKRYHMQHHYNTPEQRFGVSSPLWDWVFKTMPTESMKVKPAE